MSNEQMKVSDVVSEAFDNAYKAVSAFFETDDRHEIAPFAKVVSALRMLPAEAHDEVGIPILEEAFKTLELDPTTSTGRDAAAPFADNIALALSDAAQIIQQNMHRQAQNRAATQQKLLNPG